MHVCKPVSSVNSRKKVASEDKSDVLVFRPKYIVPFKHVVCIRADRGYECGRRLEFRGSLHGLSEHPVVHVLDGGEVFRICAGGDGDHGCIA